MQTPRCQVSALRPAAARPRGDSNPQLPKTHRGALFIHGCIHYLEHLRRWSALRCISRRRKGSPQISECPAASGPHSPPCRSSRTCPQEEDEEDFCQTTCGRRRAPGIFDTGGGGSIDCPLFTTHLCLKDPR